MQIHRFSRQRLAWIDLAQFRRLAKTHIFFTSLISLSSITGAGPEMPPSLRTRQKCTTMKADAMIGIADAVPDVGAQQRVGIHDRAAQQAEAHVVEWRHAQLRAERAVVAEQRRGARHVRAHRDRPEAELIVGQQISGEAEQQRQHQQQHAHHPVELARLLVRPGEEHAEHVQLHHDHHQVGAPAVHVAQQLAERNVALQIQDVAEGHDLRRVVVEHQQRAGEHQRDVDVERHAAHAPGVVVGAPRRD